MHHVARIQPCLRTERWDLGGDDPAIAHMLHETREAERAVAADHVCTEQGARGGGRTLHQRRRGVAVIAAPAERDEAGERRRAVHPRDQSFSARYVKLTNGKPIGSSGMLQSVLPVQIGFAKPRSTPMMFDVKRTPYQARKPSAAALMSPAT